MAQNKIRIWPINLSVTLTKLDVMGLQMPGTIKTKTRALAEQIFEDSKSVYPTVPEDTGALAATGRVEQVKGGFAIVYGGADAKSGIFVDYANQVHDDLRPRNYTKPGSGPKFVEAHYLRRTEGFGDELVALMTEVARGIIG